MKKHLLLFLILCFFGATGLHAQVDSAELAKTQPRIEDDKKDVNRLDRKINKKQRRLDRKQKRLDRKEKKRNRKMRKLNKEERKMEKMQN